MMHKLVEVFLCVILFYSLSWAEDKFVVTKVYSGEKVKLQDGRKLKYVGIDAPGEKKLYYVESKKANMQLVDKKAVVIEYDARREDGQGNIQGYVYAGNTFVNAQLLKNGFVLAYIRPPNTRYAGLFIVLQNEARKHRRGIWAYEDPNDEPYYVASKDNKKIHRPGCRSAGEISFDKKIIFRNKDEALSKGYSQDWVCNPLFKAPKEIKNE